MVRLVAMNSTSEMVRVKEAFAWVEAPDTVRLKAVAAGGDPMKLNAEETRRLAERLLKLAATLENLQAEADGKDWESSTCSQARWRCSTWQVAWCKSPFC